MTFSSSLRTGFYLIMLLIAVSCKVAQPVAEVPAQEPEEQKLANSLLWKIEGEHIKTSYLFGTIHMIAKEDYFFTEEMQSAFEASSVLALEFDISKAMDLGAQMGMLQKAFMRNDTTISDLLSAEDYKTVQDHFSEMGLPFFLFERVKPMFLTIFASDDMFSGGMFDMEEVRSYELELVEEAKSKDIRIEGLETMDYQLSIFDSIPYRDQAAMLVASIASDEDEESVMDTLVHYYKNQDLLKLDALINADEATGEYKELLLDNRNRNWIPVIKDLTMEAHVFIAVGAGHLAGQSGVIRLLRKEGLKVSPVMRNEIPPTRKL